MRNNLNLIANRINGLNLIGVRVVEDDGSVIVNIIGALDRVREVANIIHEQIGHSDSDCLWINSNNGDNGELTDFID